MEEAMVYYEVQCSLLSEKCLSCAADCPSLRAKSCSKDIETYERRLKNEGLGFVKFLKLLSDAFLASLENSCYVPVPCIATQKGSVLPRFLHDRYSSVFEDNGQLRQPVCTGCVDWLIQFLSLNTKLEVGRTPEQFDECLQGMKDREVCLSSQRLDANALLDAASFLIEQVFEDFEITEKPKHGPGSVYESGDSYTKWMFRSTPTNVQRWLVENFPCTPNNYAGRWLPYNPEPFGASRMYRWTRVRGPHIGFSRSRDNSARSMGLYVGKRDKAAVRRTLGRSFLLSGNRFTRKPNNRAAAAMDTRRRLLESDFKQYYRRQVGRLDGSRDAPRIVCLEPTLSKATAVFKSLGTDRGINIEQALSMFAQQSLGRSLMLHLERHPLTKGHVNFSDQSVNAKLALSGSLSREYAFLDLSNASDLVSDQLVTYLFRRVPALNRQLHLLRAEYTTYPTGDVIPVEKFAPMGSMLCFPTMAICLYALLIAAQDLYGFDPRTSRRMSFVYGDDIIVQREAYACVVAALESCSLVVNKKKSFHLGGFAESCGMYAFNGIEVTPTRFRTEFKRHANPRLPGRLTSDQHYENSQTYSSWVSYFNLLRRKYPRSSEIILKKVEMEFGLVPFGRANSPYPCIETERDPFSIYRLNHEKGIKVGYDPDLQCPVIFAKTLRTKVEQIPAPPAIRLARYLIEGVRETDKFPVRQRVRLVTVPHSLS